MAEASIDQELFDEFAIKIYEPPLNAYRESGRIADTADPISVVMLIVDFGTELMMNGFADFLGNSAGGYAEEIVEALQRIGCTNDAAILGRMVSLAAAGGMTHETIQQDRARGHLYEVTSFAKIHGDKWKAVLEKIYELEDQIDIERIYGHAAHFIAKHDDVFRRAVGR